MNATLFDKALIKVTLLSTIFRTNENRYLSPAYQEAEVRKDFIDKFFAALGWDVNHDEQTDPYAQEVKVERGVETRTVDYAFFLKPNYRDTHFLVEAKKPSRNIENPDFYFQTIRYGYNANCQVCVLTDFEQFHILDCRHKPDIDSALSRCLEKFTYSDYADRDKFARIYWLFSREAVANGSLAKLVSSLLKPRGKGGYPGSAKGFAGASKPVDESLLEELDEFRVALAKTFKAGNPKLDSATLTELAQRVLDRLVFMRFLEDKLIEPQPIIDKFGITGKTWQDFNTACRRLDGIYNGIVFKQHGILDAPNFRVDDDEFLKIVKEISRANSPYDFNSIPIHILGSIYERFLGKVIVATDKRVRIEDKPEVRKAGGVYYTPEYIVRYIVENTIGKLIAGKTPEQIAGMRFADIACGSGSFLLGIYDLLLQYHGNYYNANPKKTKKGDCIERDGEFYLSLGKKREILLNNIYGVDIDAQAVEVCQLSLYLKLLADETTASAHQYLLDFERQALLPSLTKNIICGNSLIGTDVLEGQLFAGDEEKKLNPMNFEDAFPEVMKGGGFDAIVGNPPYGVDFSESAKGYIREKFLSYKYKYDSYIYFIERALKKVRTGGYVSYITPELWLKLENCSPLRKVIADNAGFNLLRVCGESVFSQAVVNTIVFVLQKGVQTQNIRIERNDEVWQLPSETWKSDPLLAVDYRLRPESSALLTKIKTKSCPLSEFGEAIQGITPYDKYRGQDPELIKRRGYHFNYKHDKHCGKWLAGEDIVRYELHWSGQWLKYGPWLGAPREPRFFEGPRLLFREIPGEGKRIQAALVKSETFYHGHSITPFKLHDTNDVDLKFLLGVANSRLISWFGGLTLSNFGKEIFPKLNPQDVKTLLIPRIDLKMSVDKQKHDEIVAKVEAMLEAKKQLASAKTDKDKNYYEAKCSGLDRQIDRLVYELYGLTDNEIKIVEESSNR